MCAYLAESSYIRSPNTAMGTSSYHYNDSNDAIRASVLVNAKHSTPPFMKYDEVCRYADVSSESRSLD